MRNPQRAAAVTVAVVSISLTATTAFAATFFPSLTVGKNDAASKIYLQGIVSNPGKTASGGNRPVTIGDSLSVTGNTSVKGTLTVAKNITAKGDVIVRGDLIFPATDKGYIRAPGDSNIVGIDDDLAVLGDTYTETLHVGPILNPIDVVDRIDTNKVATNALYDFIECVVDDSGASGYATNAVLTSCWNTWIAGKVGEPAVR